MKAFIPLAILLLASGHLSGHHSPFHSLNSNSFTTQNAQQAYRLTFNTSFLHNEVVDHVERNLLLYQLNGAFPLFEDVSIFSSINSGSYLDASGTFELGDTEIGSKWSFFRDTASTYSLGLSMILPTGNGQTKIGKGYLTTNLLFNADWYFETINFYSSTQVAVALNALYVTAIETVIAELSLFKSKQFSFNTVVSVSGGLQSLGEPIVQLSGGFGLTFYDWIFVAEIQSPSFFEQNVPDWQIHFSIGFQKFNQKKAGLNATKEHSEACKEGCCEDKEKCTCEDHGHAYDPSHTYESHHSDATKE